MNFNECSDGNRTDGMNIRLILTHIDVTKNTHYLYNFRINLIVTFTSH